MNRKKMTRAERAKQFMPFAALRGFEELIREREIVPETKSELTEEDAAVLSEAVKKVKKGDIVRIKYYCGNGYLTDEGIVAGVNIYMRNITVVKKKISFDDIKELNILQRG